MDCDCMMRLFAAAVDAAPVAVVELEPAAVRAAPVAVLEPAADHLGVYAVSSPTSFRNE